MSRFFVSVKLLGWAAFASVWCAISYAQDTHASVDTLQDLKQVEIVGRRTRSKTLNAITPMQGLDAEQLLRLQPHQAGDAVKHFAGVQVKDYGGVGGMKTVSVRSLGASHTAVAYDGVLLSDAQNGQIDLGKIYLDQVRSVSLYNGQNWSLLQPARNFSAAALLQMETYALADMDSAGEYSAGFDFGSFLSLSPSFSARKSMGRWGISASGRFDYIKGDYPFEVDLGGTVLRKKRENSDVRGGNAEVNIFGRPSDRHALDLKLFYYGSERGLPGVDIDYYKASAQRLEDEQFFGVLKHTWQISSVWTQRNILKYGFLYNRFTDPESLSQRAVDDRYTQQEVYVSSSVLYTPPVKGLEFSAAVDAAFTFLDANLQDFVYPWRGSLWGNIAGKYSHPYVEVMANALFTGVFDRVKFGSQPADKFRVSPFASVAVFPLGKRVWSLRVFYKDIFRVPTFNDLYYSRMGNTGLVPEKARQVNVGTTVSISEGGNGSSSRRIWSLEASVDFYRNWVTDKIVAYPTKNLFIWSMMNLGKVDITGMDAGVRVGSAFGYSGLAHCFRWEVSGSYTLQDAVDRTDPENGTYGHRVAYTPRHSGSGSASVSYQAPRCGPSPKVFQRIEISYRVLGSGVRYVLNENKPENRLAPYAEHSLSLNLGLRIKRVGLETGAEWLNFTGCAYEVVRNYPMPLASWRVHLKCRF